MTLGKAAGTVAARGRGGVERSFPKAFIKYSNAQQQSLFSNESNNTCTTGDEDGHNFGVWPPNQTTAIFSRMETKCPDVMQAYARCVIDKQNGGALVQGACEEQFRAVMACFRSVRLEL